MIRMLNNVQDQVEDKIYTSWNGMFCNFNFTFWMINMWKVLQVAKNFPV